MSKPTVLVYVCTGKDCRKVWDKQAETSPGKWLRRRAEEEGLDCKVQVIKTDCMDLCDQAACLCAVRGECARLVTDVRPAHDAGRVVAALRHVAGGEREPYNG